MRRRASGDTWADVRDADAVVFAMGFERTARFTAELNGEPLQLECWGSQVPGRIAIGLYGVGIGFPERWVDLEGDAQPRVGFGANFSGYVGRMVRGEDAGAGAG